ncbi:hypothetical protein DB346_01980 [Verrucomicrobia bacterium LW23]|nr:hypothetical protein DB346_01980 [Verrucomicrobia bacterium LW23]
MPFPTQINLGYSWLLLDPVYAQRDEFRQALEVRIRARLMRRSKAPFPWIPPLDEVVLTCSTLVLRADLPARSGPALLQLASENRANFTHLELMYQTHNALVPVVRGSDHVVLQHFRLAEGEGAGVPVFEVWLDS